MSNSDNEKETSGGENAAETTTVANAQRLQVEIDVFKAKVFFMPEITEGMTIEQRRSVADAKRSLWNKLLEQAWIFERQRVRECVDEAKELGLTGPPDVVECPFCFDDISEQLLKSIAATGEGDFATIFSCCGKVCCFSCTPKLVRSNPNTCPFCRSKLGLGEKETAEELIKRAKSGDAVSQCSAAALYFSGSGVAEDAHKEFYWYKRAALQGNSDAQGKLGTMYLEGRGCDQSYSEAERFLKMAAKKSCPGAQYCLGIVMSRQERKEEELQWYTLSASQGSIIAQTLLASLHDQTSENMILSLYWSKKSALAGDEDSFYRTTTALILVTLKIIGRDSFDFPTMVKEVGRNPIPEILFWLRKAASAKESEDKELATEERNKYESLVRERCSGCWELAESFDDRLKACRCHAAFYCSKKCQIGHWKGGHVLDCCDKDGKFHPCPNDEKYN